MSDAIWRVRDTAYRNWIGRPYEREGEADVDASFRNEYSGDKNRFVVVKFTATHEAVIAAARAIMENATRANDYEEIVDPLVMSALVEALTEYDAAKEQGKS